MVASTPGSRCFYGFIEHAAKPFDSYASRNRPIGRALDWGEEGERQFQRTTRQGREATRVSTKTDFFVSRKSCGNASKISSPRTNSQADARS